MPLRVPLLAALLCLLLCSLLLSPRLQAADSPLSLWHFKTPNADVYLLGSIHAMRPDMYPLPRVMRQAYEQAEVVIFEVDLAQTSIREMSQVLQNRGLYPPSQGLEDELSSATAVVLARYLEQANLDIDKVYRMRPWFLNVTLGQEILVNNGYQPELGIDQQLQTWALRDGKQIRQLETFAEQVEVLAGDPPEIQDLALRVSLQGMASADEDLRQLVAAWRKGDAQGMLDQSLVVTEQYPALESQMERLIFARNELMAERILAEIKAGGDYLIVVGALHMGGDRGLLALLGDHYKIRQLKDAE